MAPHSDRRRRLIAEDRSSAEPAVEEIAPKPSRRKARIPAAALMEPAPRIVDLIPKKWSTFGVVYAIGFSIVVALAALYWKTFEFARTTSDGRIEAFDLDGEGSLAVWYSSFLLTLAAAVTYIIYSVRKRHVGDYRARYRVWGWASLLWLLMSIDETGSLHEGFKELMSLATGARLTGDGSAWWAIAYVVVLAPIGFLMWREMSANRAGRIALGAAAACFALAVAAQMQWILAETGMVGVTFEECFEMIGFLTLLTAMTIHARHVVDESAEAAAGGKRKRGRGKSADDKPAPTRTIRRKRAPVVEEVEEEEEEAEEEEESEEESEGEEAEADSEEEEEYEEEEEEDEEELTRPAPTPAKPGAQITAKGAAAASNAGGRPVDPRSSQPQRGLVKPSGSVAPPAPTKPSASPAKRRDEDEEDDWDDDGDERNLRYDEDDESGPPAPHLRSSQQSHKKNKKKNRR